MRIIKDQKGGGSLEVLFAVVLLVFIFFMTIEPVIVMYKNQVLEQAKMKGLDAMQARGGLDGEIENALREYLTNRGFESSKIAITGTIAPVNWGEEVALEIRYQDEMKVYKRKGLSLERTTEQINYHLFGSTTSYFFDNN